MSIDRSQIEQEFRRLNFGTNIEKLREQAEAIQGDRLTSVTSRLGMNTDASFGGFQSLTTELDDVVSQLDFSIPQQLVDRMGVAQMTAQVPEISDRLITTLDAAANDLAAITETASSTLDNAMNNVVISGTTPAAIAASLGQVAEVTIPEVTSIMNNIVDVNIPFSEGITVAQSVANQINPLTGLRIPPLPNISLDPINNFAEEVIPQIANLSLDNVVTQAVTNVTKIADANIQLFNDVAKNSTAVLNSINVGLDGILPNIIESVSGPTLSTISSLASVNGVALTVPNDVLTNVRSLIQSSNFSKASQLLQSFSDRPLNEIEDALRSVNTTLSGNIATAGGTASIPVAAIGSNEASWDEANTSPDAFSVVATHEELEVELKSATREITEVIVDWTRTFTNQNLGAEDFQEINTTFGNSVAHHYFIRRDGSLQRGRPINVLGPRLVNNHNRYAVLVAFVGGVNAPLGTVVEEVDRYLSKNSLTSAQMNTFKIFMEKAFTAWPGLQALGINEIDQTKVAPGFLVTEYVADMFSKATLYTDPLSQQALNRTTIVSTPLENYDYDNQVPRIAPGPR
jgi:N-acetylmuramoyl-L-alanine amidase